MILTSDLTSVLVWFLSIILLALIKVVLILKISLGLDGVTFCGWVFWLESWYWPNFNIVALKLLVTSIMFLKICDTHCMISCEPIRPIWLVFKETAVLNLMVNWLQSSSSLRLQLITFSSNLTSLHTMWCCESSAIISRIFPISLPHTYRHHHGLSVDYHFSKLEWINIGLLGRNSCIPWYRWCQEYLCTWCLLLEISWSWLTTGPRRLGNLSCRFS